LSNPVGLKGPTGAAGSDGSSVSIYATIDNLPLAGNTAGDQAYVTAVNRFYIFNGTGWYSISLVNTNPNITSVADASSNTTPFTLSTDGSASVITITATDPEDVPLTYTYSVTSGSLSNGGGTTATVVQGTGSNTNKFTVTPSTTEAYAGTFSLTFTASDGINTATSANSFTLNFITIVTNSKYTTLLATATGTSDNNNIADTSSNNHSITVTGDAYAGTFSPYRHGGYSAYFGTGGSERITIEGTKSTLAGANADFSIGAWIYPTAGNDKWIYSTNVSNNLQAGWHDLYLEGSTKLVWRHSDGSTHRSMMSTNPVSLNEWSYILINRTSNVTYMYINGSLVVQNSDMTYALYTHTNAPSIGIRHFYDNGTTGLDFEGYITDVHVKTAAISSPTTVPTERAVADSDTWLLTAHLPYFGDGSSNNYTVSAYNNVSTKPYTQYDNLEYASADHGGSVYFDRASYNSGGCITVADHNDFTLGTSDWTVKFWVYHNELITSSNNAYGYFSNYYFNTPGGFGLKWMNQHGNKPVLEYMNSGSYAKKIFDFIPSEKIWYYYELTCSSSTVTFKVNGDTIGTQSMPDLGNPNRTLIVGAASNGSSGVENFLGGYIADFQYVIGGTASESSVPTALMSTDSNSALHIKGTDASIIDKSQSSNLKMFGNSTGSTTQVKFAGSKSMYFDGTGDYISIPADDSIFSKDYTVEFWMYPTQDTNLLMPFSKGYGLQFYHQSGNIAAAMSSSNNGTYFYNGNFGSITTNAWSHISLVRDSSASTYKFYINGTLEDTLSSATNIDAGSSNWIIAAFLTSGNYAFEGYIQDVRVTDGLARYTANFTPPTASLEG
jgi:hypothetical protein